MPTILPSLLSSAPPPLSTRRVLSLSLPLRLLAALLARAFFQPDEYWQNLEVAHRWVWGYGHLTWEWQRRVEVGSTGEMARWVEMVRWAAAGGGGGIRSPLSVVPTAVVYWVLKTVGWDQGGVVVLAPRLVQALIAASTDVAVFRLSNRVLGPRYARATLLASLLSFFHFFILSRTLSNSTETALTCWALVYWPFSSPFSSPSPSIHPPTLSSNPLDDEANKGHGAASSSSSTAPTAGAGAGNLALALSLAAAATIIRPSNAVIWLFLGIELLARSSSTSHRLSILRTVFFVGSLASLLTLLLDSLFYFTPTFTPLRFLHSNLLSSISLFYGSNSSHFYLSQGLPLLLMTQLPFFVDGVRRALQGGGIGGGVKDGKALGGLERAAAGTVGTYSLLAHKEWRFLHPLLPIFHLFVALSLVELSSSPASASPSASSSPSSASSSVSRSKPPTTGTGVSAGVKKRFIALLAVSLVPAVYLTAFHGVGQNDVMHYLREVIVREDSPSSSPAASSSSGGPGLKKGGKAGPGGEAGVGFLMPCHSTGWQAFLRAPQLERKKGEEGEEEGSRAWWIGCEPPVLGQNASTYLDQSDHFYASPSSYLLSRFPPSVDPAFPAPPSLPPSPPRPDEPFDLGWTHTWPLRLVVFSNLLDVPCSPSDECGLEGTVGALLSAKGYGEEKRFWNTLGGWHDDERRRGEVVVLRWGTEGGRGG